MLASISPVGEASRHQRWGVTVTAYLVGSVAGGAAVGTLMGAIGAAVATLLGAARPVLAAAVGTAATGTGAQPLLVAALLALGLVAIGIDRGHVPLRLPSWQRQVDERWLTTYRGWVYGAGFGLQLGAGVLTRIPTAAVHLMLVLAAATGSVREGLMVGAAFGLARALPLLSTVRLRDPAALQRFHRRVDGAGHLADRAVTLAVVGGLGGVVVVTMAAG